MTNRERHKIICGIVGVGTCAHSHMHLYMCVFEGLKAQDLARVRQIVYHGAASSPKPVKHG